MKPQLEVISSDEGFVVHDSERALVHYLNETAAIVFSLCDGERDAEAIAALIKEYFGLAEAPIEDVEQALAQLLSQGVLVDADGGLD